MKKVLITVIVGLCLLVGCSTTAEQAEKRQRKAVQVERSLSERHFTVETTMMRPRRGRTINLTGRYSLEVRGNTLISALPYFGRAYNIPYGGGKGLTFMAPITAWQEQKVRKDMWRVVLETENDEDQYIFQLDIFDNGSATIYMNSRERESISYSGEIDLRPRTAGGQH